MTRRQLHRRLRARLDGDQRGFTLIETIIAITVIFASLVTLAAAASSAFRYVALARERQAATAIATQVLEQAKALDTTTLAKGLLTTDLSDSNIKSGCSGDPVVTYRFESCAGEKIVNSSTASPVTPLVPHVGTISSDVVSPVTYKTYVTNDDPATYPYRIIVEVSWSVGSVAGASQVLRVETLVFSPKGCAAAGVVHPFAGPCQPYFNGSATQSQGSVTISGTINGQSVNTTVYIPYVEARSSMEQVGQVQGYVTQGGTLNGSISTGLGSISTAADGNPSTSTGTYDPAPAVPPKTLSVIPGLQTVVAAPTLYTISTGSSGVIGWSTSASQAGASAKCPSPSSLWPLYQSDGAPCSWASVQRNGSSTASLNITRYINDNTSAWTAGTAMLFGGEVPSASTNAYTDKIPAGSTAGRLDTTLNRTLGTIYLLGIPSGITSPSLAGTALTDASGALNATSGIAACTGGNYLISISGYSDSASASSGLSAAAPSASVQSGATVKFWDPSTSPATCRTYTNAGLNSSTPQQPSVKGFSVSRSKTITGKSYVMSWNMLGTGTTPADTSVFAKFGGAGTSRTPLTGTTIKDATATTGSPLQGSFRYQIVYTFAGMPSTIADLTVTVDFGGLSAKSQFIPAPTGG